MAKQTLEGTGRSVMDMAREIMRSNTAMKWQELQQRMQAKFGVAMTPKMAENYRYKIAAAARASAGSGARRKQRLAARAARGSEPSKALSTPAVSTYTPPAASTDTPVAMDSLLQAAQSLGWNRVKEIVDGVMNAPG